MTRVQILDQLKDQRTRCEIWTRVMGYHRPISTFNPGKKSEQAERVLFRESLIGNNANTMTERHESESENPASQQI